MRRYNKISGIKGSEKTAALKGPWTAEEDKKIMTLVREHGAKRWSQIAAELPGTFTSLSICSFAHLSTPFLVFLRVYILLERW